MGEYIDGWERPVDADEARAFNIASAPTRRIEERVDALFKDAIRIREESVDDGVLVECEYAENIAHYLYEMQIPKALIECREAVEMSNHYIDGFKTLADEIVKLLDMPRYPKT
jgi:hypothetical protein